MAVIVPVGSWSPPCARVVLVLVVVAVVMVVLVG
ncbi:hypothetical protein F4560_001894 [Saccharothrix ecbatanensis]|uniref:Uncharacterized protein n=1 Tax=Saccharothrix ecbatanensis TaxID=1105145 RepID=A0A7W9HHI6_9PSEU|nr:hypothetical protein [Saccharothrix ecbatanensis]